MSEQPSEQELKEAHQDWQKDLMDSVKERAKLAGELPIPDLDEMMFTTEYLEADYALALQFITSSMRSIRNTTGWKSEDLKLYKQWRQKLLPYRQACRNLAISSEASVKDIQDLLQQFYAEVQVKVK